MGERPGELRPQSAAAANDQPTNMPTGSATNAGQGDLPEMRAELEHIRSDLTNTIDEIEAKLTPEHLAQEAAGQVRQQVQSQKGRVADGLISAAQVLRQTGSHMREQDQSAVAEYLDGAAEQVERLSRSLRDRDVGQLVGELEQFARRQPVLFVGSAFAVGLLGARFLKSSSQTSTNIGGGSPSMTAGGRVDTEVYGPGFEGMGGVPTSGTRL